MLKDTVQGTSRNQAETKYGLGMSGRDGTDRESFPNKEQWRCTYCDRLAKQPIWQKRCCDSIQVKTNTWITTPLLVWRCVCRTVLWETYLPLLYWKNAVKN